MGIFIVTFMLYGLMADLTFNARQQVAWFGGELLGFPVKVGSFQGLLTCQGLVIAQVAQHTLLYLNHETIKSL